MNLKEAYNILELPQGTSIEEAKKKFKKLAVKYHPDVNKDPSATDKFKQINEAISTIEKGEDEPSFGFPFSGNPFSGNPFNRQEQHVINAENINLYTTITFEESILGKKQDLKFSRDGKCSDCNGQGHIRNDNGCEKCGGKGQTVTRQGNFVFSQTCNKCHGKTNVSDCKSCDSTGSVNTDVNVTVTIPGGISDGNVLRLAGMGNYVGNFMGHEQFTNAFLHVSVTAMSGLSLSGSNVISSLDLTMLEAIEGCNKTVKTVLGDKEIEIKPLSKNKDEVIIPNVGVNRIGNQHVILNVSYPSDVSKLIEVLK